MSTASEARQLATEADARLRAKTNPERQEFTQGYFPSRLENLGVALTDMRVLLRDLAKRTKKEHPEHVLEVARAILVQRTLEGRNLAYLLLNKRPDTLALLGQKELDELGQGNDNWTSVDTFGCYVAGPVWREGGIKDASVKRWARSKDRWWRRTALVCTIAWNMPSRGGRGGADATRRTLALCELLSADHDDMVVKGMSWALRGLALHAPEEARGFLADHPELHSRVKREVGNKLETGKKTPSFARRKKA